MVHLLIQQSISRKSAQKKINRDGKCFLVAPHHFYIKIKLNTQIKLDIFLS